MKNRKIILILSVALVLTLFTGCVQKKETSEAAVVNGESISIEDYKEELKIYKNMYESQYGEEIWNVEISEGKSFERYLKENVLDNMILDMALEQAAIDSGIEVSDEEAEEFFDNYKDQFETEEEYDDFLESNSLTEDYLKSILRKNLIIDEYLETQLEITDEKLEEFYENNINSYTRIKANHILVEDNELAQDILSKLEDGEDFSELAKEYSIDTHSAENGGDLGFFGMGRMVAEFEEAAFDLEVGEISGLVESQHGIHIIEKTDEEITPFEDVKDVVEQEYKEKMQNDIINEIEENAEIERKVDYDSIELETNGQENTTSEDPVDEIEEPQEENIEIEDNEEDAE